MKNSENLYVNTEVLRGFLYKSLATTSSLLSDLLITPTQRFVTSINDYIVEQHKEKRS